MRRTEGENASIPCVVDHLRSVRHRLRFQKDTIKEDGDLDERL